MADLGVIALVLAIIAIFLIIILFVLILLNYSRVNKTGVALRVVQGSATDSSFTTNGNDIYIAAAIPSLTINKDQINLQGTLLYIVNTGNADLILSGGSGVTINGTRKIPGQKTALLVWINNTGMLQQLSMS